MVTRGMRRTTKLWVLAAGLIVASIVLKREFFGGAIHSPNQNMMPSIQTSPLDPRRSNDPKADRIYDSASGEMTALQSGNSKLPEALPPSGFDASVIGIPFPVSASVEATCKLGGPSVCTWEHDKLSEMAKEPRDKAWAAEMEAKLQSDITSRGADKYSIRDIECRSSICAVEVASIFGQYFAPDYDFLRTNELVARAANGTTEIDPSGNRIDVTLMIFTDTTKRAPADW